MTDNTATAPLTPHYNVSYQSASQGLESLRSVGGLALLHADQLLNLTGLEGLAVIDGPLVLEDNHRLDSADGLSPGLRWIGSDLWVK